MSPGLWLAVAWLARVAAWGAMAYGAILLCSFTVIVLVLSVTPPTHPAVPIVIGSAVFAVGLYVERRARSKIRRLTPDRTPRGFEVVRPTDPAHHP